jgi:hypothetical protein
LNGQPNSVSVIGKHYIQLHFNFAELVIRLNRVVRPSKLWQAEPVEICNSVDVWVWAVLNISLPGIILIHHSICQKFQDAVRAV